MSVETSTDLLHSLQSGWINGDTAIVDLDGTLLQATSWDQTPQGYAGLCERYGKFHGDAIWKSRVMTNDFMIPNKEEIAKWLSDKDHLFLTDRSCMLLKATDKLLASNGFQAQNLVVCQGIKVDFLAKYAAVNIKKRFVIADDSDVIIKKMKEKLPVKSVRRIIKVALPQSQTYDPFVFCKHYGKVIGLSGKMGSGKDAATEILIKHIYENLKCVIVRFADALKQFVSELIPDKVYSENTKSNVVKFRDADAAKAAIERFNLRVGKLKSRELNPLLVEGFLLRFLDKEMSWSKWHAQVGGYCRQDCGEDVFVQLAELAIMENVERYDMVIVNDTRFVNEWELLMRLGVPMIRLERDEKLRESSFNGRDPNNVSENNLDQTPFEHHLKNNTNDLTDLERKLIDIVFCK